MDGTEVIEIGNGNNGGEQPVTEFVIDPTNNDGIPVIDPQAIAGTPDGTGEPPKRRGGRPKGSRNTPGGKQGTKEVSQDLGSLLFTIHFFLSKALKIDELKLDEEESKQLGAALARVQKEFGVAVIPPKVAAMINLATVAGFIYVPRVVAIGQNKKNKRAETVSGKVNGQATVIDMPIPNVMM